MAEKDFHISEKYNFRHARTTKKALVTGGVKRLLLFILQFCNA